MSGDRHAQVADANRDPEISGALSAVTDVTDAPRAAPPVTELPSPLMASLEPASSEPALTAGAPPDAAAPPFDSASDSAWRDELSARLTRYRARRKLPPPRYPSLTLRFDPAEASRQADSPHASPLSFEPFSDQSLALAPVASPSPQVSQPEFHVSLLAPAAAIAPPQGAAAPAAAPSLAHPGAKIIEFPRFAWAPPPPPLDQLAEPISTRPRILEVPEFAPPPPALGGITMEPVEREAEEKRPGIDVPLQTASLTRRIFATGVDTLIVAAAAAIFGFIFWKITQINPPLTQTAELAAAIPCLFWAIYQYLLIVYSGCTPGLRAAGLELTRFDGSPTSRSLRRWRVIAGFLSAASLGMGYAWVFLDEDSLCWHDRATRTHLAPKVAGGRK